MRSVDADAATKILGCLRSGAYDEVLKFKAPETPRDNTGTEAYPWAKEM